MSVSGDAPRQSLDAIGRLHYAVHQGLRDLGYPGFACQMHVHLDGRVSLDALRQGLDNLARRYPVLTARLVREAGRTGDIYWEPREGVPCPLTVTEVVPDGDAAVHRHAESLMTGPFDLPEGEPIRFHLLRREGAGDVLVVYYDHTLIGDAHAAIRLARELDALSSVPVGEVRPAGPEPNEIDPYVTGHNIWKRWFRVARLFSAYGKLRPPLTLMEREPGEGVYDACRISAMTLDERQTAAFVERVKRACGFPNVSMALLASCYRAVHRAAGSPRGRDRCLACGVGYSLRPSAGTGAIFRWFGTEMILPAFFEELEDRDSLTRLLVQRTRTQIRHGFDVASLHLARIGGRHVQKVRRGFRRRMREMSFSYGFFRAGEASEGGLCGAGIVRAEHLIMPWSPPGLTISATTCRGRLHLLVGTCVEAVPEPRLRKFLDYLAEDLSA